MTATSVIKSVAKLHRYVISVIQLLI